VTLASEVRATYLTWHPRKEVVLVATQDGDLLELDPRLPAGQYRVLVSGLPQAGEERGNHVFWGVPERLAWFSAGHALFLPSDLGAGVFSDSGVSLGPSFRNDGDTIVVCLWASQTDGTFIVGAQVNEGLGEGLVSRPKAAIARYKIGGAVGSGEPLALLPCELRHARVSPDGTRIAFAWPGPGRL